MGIYQSGTYCSLQDTDVIQISTYPYNSTDNSTDSKYNSHVYLNTF